MKTHTIASTKNVLNEEDLNLNNAISNMARVIEMPKVNRELNYQKYLETLEESTCATVSVNSKRSKNHQI